jgi:glycosyltransferase involved in cell wall biosynthesis
MDVFSEGMKQLASRHRLWKWMFNWEAKRLAAYERTIYKDFDSHIIISNQDRERLKLPSKQHIAIIPNGVDAIYWDQNSNQIPNHDLVFVGNLGYGPNKATALFLVQQVLPELQKRKRKVKVLIAGARPGYRVAALDKRKEVTVEGWVKDIRNAYRGGRIFVAPMFSGLGQQK